MKEQENKPFKIGDVIVQPGTRQNVQIPLPALPEHSAFDLRLKVIQGSKPGKRLFISSTLHGDELNGIEIIRRVLASPLLEDIHGTLVAIPIVNLFGLINQSRYLPDRRDLNRSFPGSSKGSTAAQLANTFLEEVVMKCTHGIDLHTGSNHRTNLPQIRCDFREKKAMQMAIAFGAPVVLKAELREGSLRENCDGLKIPTITFEGGEALRFNENAIRSGVQGILRVMSHLGMIPKDKSLSLQDSSSISPTSRWIRAPSTGLFRTKCELGQKVSKGDVIGKISDMLGTTIVEVVAKFDGIVIGQTLLPTVYRGDALFNVAWVPDPTKTEEQIEELEEELELNPSLDDPSTF